MERASEVRAMSLLLVDDEVDILESLRDLFEGSLDGVHVRTAESGPAALRALEEGPVDLIITDYKMPGMSGLELLALARHAAPGVPRILISAFPDLEVALRAINEAGIENFITKPFEPDQVVEVVRAVLAERRAAELRSQAFAPSLDLLRQRMQQAPPRP